LGWGGNLVLLKKRIGLLATLGKGCGAAKKPKKIFPMA